MTETINFFDWYDYGARFYDPQIGRWLGIDLAAEISKKVSPYTYCFNNPIKYFDIDGLIPLSKIVKGGVFGSKFGPRDGAPHKGLDIRTNRKLGVEVRAAASGVVEKIGWQDSNNDEIGWGYYMLINHGNGYKSLYAHLTENGEKVSVGDKIDDGMVIALSGSTGESSGPHLHIEFIGPGEIRFDPEDIDDLQEFLENMDHPIMLKEVVVYADKDRSLYYKLLQLNYFAGIDNEIHPNRRRINDFGYNGSYWQTLDKVRLWGEKDDEKKKENSKK